MMTIGIKGVTDHTDSSGDWRGNDCCGRERLIFNFFKKIIYLFIHFLSYKS